MQKTNSKLLGWTNPRLNPSLLHLPRHPKPHPHIHPYRFPLIPKLKIYHHPRLLAWRTLPQSSKTTSYIQKKNLGSIVPYQIPHAWLVSEGIHRSSGCMESVSDFHDWKKCSGIEIGINIVNKQINIKNDWVLQHKTWTKTPNLAQYHNQNHVRFHQTTKKIVDPIPRCM